MSPTPPLTRRTVLGGGLALSWQALAPRAFAQAGNVALDRFRLLRAAPGAAALRGAGAEPTSIWGYDGGVPGPTLRCKRSEEVRVRLVNELPEPTTLHWHGLRIGNGMDGVPHLTQAPVAPGGSFDYRFTVPDAGTFWYHPHLALPQQLARGLAGLLIVDEAEPVQTDQDMALVFADWPPAVPASHAAGPRPGPAAAGAPGAYWTVNGMPSVDIPVRTNERLRLRLLNATAARLMQLRFERHRTLVMAIDGQPAEPFASRSSAVMLGPGNRIDLFVDATLAPGAIGSVTLAAAGIDAPIARLVYAEGAPLRPEPLPEAKPLPDNPLPARMEFRSALKFEILIDDQPAAAAAVSAPPERPRSGATSKPEPRAGLLPLDGSPPAGLISPPLFTVKRGRTVMLSFANRASAAHAVHLHGHHFRLLDRLDDGWKPFWLDTVVAAPLETTRTAFVADNPGKWMLDCQRLDHPAASGAWFEVT